MQSLDERHLTSPPRPGGAFYFFDPIKQTFRYPTPSKPLKVILDQLYLYVIIAVYSARSSCPRPMLTCQAVLLTPPNFCHPRPLLSRQQSIGISPLSATLMDLPASVVNKRVTARLNPLDATLTKNTGGTSFQPKTFLSSRPTSADIPTFKPVLVIAFLSFHTLTNAPSRKPLRLTSLQMPGGMGSRSPKRPTVSSRCIQLHRRLHPSLCIQSLCYPPLSAFGESPHSFCVGGRHE